MTKTEKLLNSFGLTLDDAASILDAEMFTTLKELDRAQGEFALSQRDLLDNQILAYLKTPNVMNIITENQKEAIVSDDFGAFDDDFDDIFGDDTDDYDVRVTAPIDLGDLGEESEPPSVVEPKEEAETPMVFALKTDEISAVQFFADFVKDAIPQIDEEGALVFNENEFLIRGMFRDDFRIVQALPLDSAEMRVQIVGRDDSELIRTYGAASTIRVQEPQKVEARVMSLKREPISDVFTTQQYLDGGNAVNVEFTSIKTRLEQVNDNKELKPSLSLPLGKAVHPLQVWKSNFYLTPNQLYALADCDEFFTASVGSMRFITNFCEENDLKQLRIFEIGGPHLDVAFNNTQNKTIENSLIKDNKEFSARVSALVGDSISQNRNLYVVGFVQGLPAEIKYEKVTDTEVESLAGFYVCSDAQSGSVAYIPALVFNYFKKYYEIDGVAMGLSGAKNQKTFIFKNGDFIKGFLLLDSDKVVMGTPARLMPSKPLEYAEVVKGEHLTDFDGIDIEQYLKTQVSFIGQKEEKEVEVVEPRIEPKEEPKEEPKTLQEEFQGYIDMFTQALQFMEVGEDDEQIKKLEDAIAGAKIMLMDDDVEDTPPSETPAADLEMVQEIVESPSEEEQLGQMALGNDQEILPTPSANDPVAEAIVEAEKEDVLDTDEAKAREKVRLTFSFNPDNLSVDDAVEMVEKYTKDWRTFGDISETTISANLNFEDAEDLIPELPDGYVYDVQMFNKDLDGKEVLIFEGYQKAFDDDEDEDDTDAGSEADFLDLDLDFKKGGKIKISKKDMTKLHDGEEVSIDGVILEFGHGGGVPKRKTSIKKVMEGIRKGSGGPYAVMARMGTRLEEQRLVSYPQEVPLEVEKLRQEFPQSRIEIEDGGGRIIYAGTPSVEVTFEKGGAIVPPLKFEKVDFPYFESLGIHRHRAKGHEYDFIIDEYVTTESAEEFGDREFGGSVHLIVTDPKTGEHVDYMRFLKNYDEAVVFAEGQNQGKIGVGHMARSGYAHGGVLSIYDFERDYDLNDLEGAMVFSRLSERIGYVGDKITGNLPSRIFVTTMKGGESGKYADVADLFVLRDAEGNKIGHLPEYERGGELRDGNRLADLVDIIEKRGPEILKVYENLEDFREQKPRTEEEILEFVKEQFAPFDEPLGDFAGILALIYAIKALPQEMVEKYNMAKGGKTGTYTIHRSEELGLDDEFKYHVLGPDGGTIGCQTKKECQEVISLAKQGAIEFAKGGKTMNDKVSDKIRLLRKEGKPQEQAVAIALSMRDEGKLEKGGKISEAIDLAKEAVKAMSDEEVATTLVDVIFSSLDSLEVDTTEDEALAEARKDIEHSRNLLMNILDEAQTPAP